MRIFFDSSAFAKRYVSEEGTDASLERNTLRGMDVIHIGSAVAMQADLFVSADARQCATAAAVGLEVAAV
jgi:predicted nucleic acid-binding protein